MNTCQIKTKKGTICSHPSKVGDGFCRRYHRPESMSAPASVDLTTHIIKIATKAIDKKIKAADKKREEYEDILLDHLISWNPMAFWRQSKTIQMFAGTFWQDIFSNAPNCYEGSGSCCDVIRRGESVMELKNRHNTVKKGDLGTTYDGIIKACKEHDVSIGVYGYINLAKGEDSVDEILREENGITLRKITGDKLFQYYFGDEGQEVRQTAIDLFNSRKDFRLAYGLQ